jgi:hypothetical protein
MNGLLYIVYGKEYVKLSIASIRRGRKFTNLPIFVVTNVRDNRWAGIPNVTMCYRNREQKDNRKAKLQMNRLSPFDNTLYIDCDTIIQRPGVEKAFQLLEGANFCMNRLTVFDKKLPKLYKRCMKKLGTQPPMTIFNGGIIGWRKGEAANKFFDAWYRAWQTFAHGREMPPLNCVIKKLGLTVAALPKDFFEPHIENPQAVIQHNWAMKPFCKRFGLPIWREYKPYNSRRNRNDFHWTNW